MAQQRTDPAETRDRPSVAARSAPVEGTANGRGDGGTVDGESGGLGGWAEALLAAEGPILRMIGGGGSLAEVLDALCRMIEGFCPGAYCSVLLLDPDGGPLRWAAAPGLPAPFREALESAPVGPGGASAVLGAPAVAPDIASDPLWDRCRAEALEAGLRACWSVPIRSSAGGVLGTFGTFFGEVRPPRAHELRLCERSASLASIAVERHRAEESLRAGEAQYRRIVETANEGIWLLDEQQRTVFVNGRMAELLGYRPEEMVGRPAWDFVFREDHDEGRRRWEERRRDRGVRSEFRLRRKDGEAIWARTSTAPIVDADGRLSGALGMFTDITEERVADLGLRQSEQRFRQLAETMPQIVWTADAEGSVDYFNARWFEYSGMPPDATFAHDGWRAIIHPDDLPDLYGLRNRAVVEGEVFEAEVRLRDREGAYRWHLLRSVPVRDGSARVSRRFGTATDIDDRKRAEQDARFLAEASAALASIVDEADTLQRVAHLAVPYFADWCSVDLAGEGGTLRRLAVAHVDPERVQLAHELKRRYPPDADLDRGVPQVIRSGRSALVPEITGAMLGAGARDEEHLRILGELGLRSYMCAPLTGRGGTLGAISFVAAESGRVYGPDDLRLAEDLGRRAAIAIENARLYADLKEADRAKGELVSTLLESESRFRTLADSIPQLAWMARPDGWIFWYNRRWFEYTGTVPEQMLGWGWQSVHDPDELPRVMANYQSAIASGEPWEDTFPLRRHDGAMRWHLSRARPVRDERGEVVRWFGTNTDITDRRQMEEALRDADRRKDEFLATLAHELRNPLAPIRNALYLMRPAEGGTAATESDRAMAERQVIHLSRLVDDLMDISRITRGRIDLRKEPVDLAAIIAQVVETTRPQVEERHHRLSVSLPDGSLRVEGDPTRLEQVLWNLLNNAVKYTEPGGLIRLSAERRGTDVVLRVGDTGIGIAPEMLPRIFEMFVQVEGHRDRAQGGLGIGLSLVKTLVEMHGGHITAASGGLGQGTEFVVRLPVAVEVGPGHPEPKAPDHPKSDPRPPRRRVLVVDDNEDAARSLARVLERLYGQEVRVAHDGPQALDEAAAFLPEAILLDLGMPGMDGHEVARRLRARPESAGILLMALTGWGQQADREKSREAGFDHHLVKPIDPETVSRLLAGLSAGP